MNCDPDLHRFATTDARTGDGAVGHQDDRFTEQVVKHIADTGGSGFDSLHADQFVVGGQVTR